MKYKIKQIGKYSPLYRIYYRKHWWQLYKWTGETFTSKQHACWYVYELNSEEQSK